MLPPLRTISPISTKARPSLSILLRRFSSSSSPSNGDESEPIPPIFTPEVVLHTISTYSNDWSRAIEFFHWVSRRHGFVHTAPTYNATIDVLGKFFEFDLIWSLVRRMPNPDRTTFRVIFKRYAAAHLVNDAVEAFEKSEEFGLKDRACFHQLIDALCEFRHVVEAEEICFRKDPPFSVDTKIYNMMLRGWYKMGWWRKCWEFWERMDNDGVEKDLHSYSTYMSILSKAGKPWRTVKVYNQIREKGVVLDVVAYNIVIQAVGSSDGVDCSIRLLREMMDLGCRPNVITFNTIVKLLCCSGRFKEAYGFLARMRENDCEPNERTYHCFFQYLNDPKEILWLFKRMMQSGCRPTMDTYVMLLKKFGRWGFLTQVLHVWQVMEGQGISPDSFAYNALIDALIQEGMIDRARKYDEEMLAKGLSAKPRKELGAMSLAAESDIKVISS